MREDILPAPLFALSFNNGASVAVLDPSPRGDTTVEETRLSQAGDDRCAVSVRRARSAAGGRRPHRVRILVSRHDELVTRAAADAPARPRWIRRYHPIAQGVAHSYEVSFRFGQNESFRDVTRNAWRWAWNTLNPAVTYIDVEQMRRVSDRPPGSPGRHH